LFGIVADSVFPGSGYDPEIIPNFYLKFPFPRETTVTYRGRENQAFHVPTGGLVDIYMKNPLSLAIAGFLCALCLLAPAARSEDRVIQLYEEDKSYWKDVLADTSIAHKNQFYAAYVAYKERLNDLSVESFRETINANPANGPVRGISCYYLGKNYFLQGKYAEAIEQFSMLKAIDLGSCGFIRHCAVLNSAIAYHRLKNNDKCRENLQVIIAGDADKMYKSIALDILKSIQ
jgi:tetratricopeptide (TPR) repeat protein